jgi:hypothetical protein
MAQQFLFYFQPSRPSNALNPSKRPETYFFPSRSFCHLSSIILSLSCGRHWPARFTLYQQPSHLCRTSQGHSAHTHTHKHIQIQVTCASDSTTLFAVDLPASQTPFCILADDSLLLAPCSLRSIRARSLQLSHPKPTPP